MVRTRVGYAGGSTTDPTYRSIGDHSETVQIDYDPSQISYEELLDTFWEGHTPTSRPSSQQYASIIFYHDQEQKRLAMASKDRLEADLGKPVFTEIVPMSRFYLAEDYHQKYYLQQVAALLQDLRAIYPAMEDFVNSTAAARVNGYVGGFGSLADLESQIDDLGLTVEGKRTLLSIVESRTK